MRYYLLAFILFSNAFAFDASMTPGMQALDFTLQDSNGHNRSLHDYTGKIIVLEWRDPRCNYVTKYYNTHKMQDLQKYYQDKYNVVWLTILLGADKDVIPSEATATLLDPAREVTQLYNITKVPEVVIIDQSGVIAYVGAVDSVRSYDEQDVARASMNYIENALDALIANYPVTIPQTRPFGCQTASFSQAHYQQV